MTQPVAVRRVVVGSDARGHSFVQWDSPAPNSRLMEPGMPSMVSDIWVWNETPVPLDGNDDAGNLKYDFPGPPQGGHVRVIKSAGKPADYDANNDPKALALHEVKAMPNGRTWDRGGRNAFTTDMHKTQSIDYAIELEGERVLGMDDGRHTIHQGDIVVQVGAWHQWSRPGAGSTMMYDMFAAQFVDGPQGLAQGNDAVMRPGTLPAGARPQRRLVTIDEVAGKGKVVSDGASPDVRTDPARPGFTATRVWVTDSHPAKIVRETLHLPHAIEPPTNGSVCRVYSLPPDAAWQGKVGKAEVAAYFKAMGSPSASVEGPHPYMQQTRTLDICAVLEGEVTLVLDSGEVTLRSGEVAVIRGSRHAWANRSGARASVAVCSHDGKRS